MTEASLQADRGVHQPCRPVPDAMALKHCKHRRQLCIDKLKRHSSSVVRGWCCRQRVQQHVGQVQIGTAQGKMRGSGADADDT